MDKEKLILTTAELEYSLNYFNTKNFYRAYIKDFLIKRCINSDLQLGYACWGQCTDKLDIQKRYKEFYIEIKIINDKKLFRENYKHYCFFNLDDIKSFLEILSNEYNNITFKIKEDDHLGMFDSSGYTLFIEMKDTSRLKILWILSLIRHIYEFPFNVFLRDAIELKKLPKFKDQHIANLLQIVATVAHRSGKLCYSYSQSLGYTGKRLIDLVELNTKLFNITHIFDIYSFSQTEDFISRVVGLPDFIRANNKMKYPISSFGYWFNSEDWNKERLKFYEAYYDDSLKG